MPRIRSIKIGFFQNETLCALSPWHRLLFEGLWVLADRDGRLEDRPLRIKAQLFPYDDLRVDPLLEDLASSGFITRYAADGAAYLAVLTFWKHQRPKSDEPESLIPAPTSVDPRGIARPRARTEDRGQRTESKGQRAEEEAPTGCLAADGPAADESADGAVPTQRRAEDFADLWNTRTAPPIARCRDLTTKRRRQIKARMTERPWEEWAAVMDRIQASAFCRGENDRGWKASFDWLIGSPDVAVKTLEGKYDDRVPREPPFTSRELAEAKKHRMAIGRCPHETPCQGFQECVGELIRGWRRKAAAS